MELAQEHDEKVGDALICALMSEPDEQVFKHVMDFVLPRWISKLAVHIEQAQDWNLDSSRTAALMLGRHGMRIKPLEERLRSWMQSDDLNLALASMNYCGTWDVFTEEAWEAYQKILPELQQDQDYLVEIERLITVGVENHPVRFMRNLEAMLNPNAVDLSAEFLDEDEDE